MSTHLTADAVQERTDWRDLRRALAVVRRTYPRAAAVHFATSDQGLYGFTLAGVEVDGVRIADGDPFLHLADEVWELICNIAWDGVMEEDEQGDARMDLRVARPRQPYRILRGPTGSHKVIYYRDRATRDTRARHFAERDQASVLCEAWSQARALLCDPINGGWGLDRVVDASPTVGNER